AERGQGVVDDGPSRGREVSRYWNDCHSMRDLAYFSPLTKEVWRRAQQGRDPLGLDAQLLSLLALRWPNPQHPSVHW
ncbi:hypothetical protein R0J87_25395, partial [Halomonas sp. SIMBA_159]